MISLSGLRYPEDIDIKITGLRPGEKLYEELLADGENTTNTYHEKIMIARSLEINTSEVKKQIERLCIENNNATNNTIVEIIKQIVPEYLSNNSVYQKLDIKA
jgi:FlaA1/EpsC-like NDP-sugar epimerase